MELTKLPVQYRQILNGFLCKLLYNTLFKNKWQLVLLDFNPALPSLTAALCWNTELLILQNT